MQTGNGIEKRQYVRLEERRQYVRLGMSVMISYKEAGSSEGYDMTSTKDISKGGTFFFSNVNYPVGTELELLVTFPFRRGKERAKVIVKVQNVIKKDKFYGIGVKFIKIDKIVLSELHLFIDELKQKMG
ncbi:MAG: PilZ domain-containing protein [Desulfobacterales bacterium]|nr:PilZ domain-containing protein [Pseudomonadota bacterium]MCG2774055.1 PilZ domain-containing protein [Desulfobacterales bacterium]